MLDETKSINDPSTQKKDSNGNDYSALKKFLTVSIIGLVIVSCLLLLSMAVIYDQHKIIERKSEVKIELPSITDQLETLSPPITSSEEIDKKELK